MDIKSQKQQEIDNLARTLKASRLAHSDGEAVRMAQDMLLTSKKVADDFAQRDKAIYGEQRKNPEIENAHKILEQITGNITKGRSNVRIDIKELDLEKPLRELIPDEEEFPSEPDDDGERVEVEDLQFPSIQEPEKKQPFDENHLDEVDDEESEEEKDPASVIFTKVDQPEETEDFSVKELSNAPPSKSEEERKAELAKMEESKVDLSKIFGAR